MTNTDHDTIPNETTRVFHIEAPDSSGILLGILGRNRGQPARRFPPTLVVHGATFGAALFDLPVPGYSLLADLAGAGRSAYALDIRGYGRSLGGRAMDSPPAANPPFARLNEALKDIGAAVQFILKREQTTAVDLVGFSWGTVACASYASQFPRQVDRLVLYAPLYAERNEAWLRQISDPDDWTRIDPRIGAYRLITCADVARRWDNDIGSRDVRACRDQGIPEAIFETFAALDPRARACTPPAFRVPTGAFVDLIRIFNGQPLYDPRKIVVPVMLVRGAHDTTSTDSDSRRLLSVIGSEIRQYRVIDPGSHFLCVERNRGELYRSLNEFLVAVDAREPRAMT